MSLAPVDSCLTWHCTAERAAPGNPSLVPGCGAPLSPFLPLPPKVRAYTRARLKPGPKGRWSWDWNRRLGPRQDPRLKMRQ